jgi:hypothetical protein
MACWTTPGKASNHGFCASRAWKKTSGFCELPRSTGCSGDKARWRWAAISSGGSIFRNISSSTVAIFATSCEVRKPSKKCSTGKRPASVAAEAMAAMSCASWTEFEASSAKPVPRVAITSE